MTTACFLRQRGWRLGCVHAFAGLCRLQSYPCLDQFDQVAALGASCAATAAAARSRMRHLLALYIRAGGRLVFSTGSDCCSNFSAYWVLEQFQRCWGCSGSLVELESCPILLLFSSLVFRASPRTAFKCSMQAKARGLLPRIRVVALQGLSFHEGILNSVGMLFSASWNWAATASTGPQLPRPFPYARKSRAGGRLQCPQLRNVCLKFPQLVQSIVEYDI